MATDTSHACPVCSEPYADRPERCFRCETPLQAWWPFEDAARGLPEPLLGTAPGPGGRASLVPLLLAAVLGTLVPIVWIRSVAPREVATASVTVPAATVVASAPAAAGVAIDATAGAVATPREEAAAAASAVSPRVSYRVQRGDSLWRIAAALTGDGRNWSALWPSRDPSEPLAVGTHLEVTAAPTLEEPLRAKAR